MSRSAADPNGAERAEQTAEAPEAEFGAQSVDAGEAPTEALPQAPGSVEGAAAPEARSYRRRTAPTGPRRVRQGLKLRHREGVIDHTPISSAWIKLFEQSVTPEELAEGHRYARLGQTISMEWVAGGVDAVVQCEKPRPHEVKVRIGAWTHEQWDRLIRDQSNEAMWQVRLEAGEIPEGIHAMLAGYGLSLIPSDPGALVIECACGASSCRHAATAGYLVADLLVREPMLVFKLRGLPADQLIERLRQVRAIQARGRADAHSDPLIPQSQVRAMPLEACVDDYWRGPAGAEENQIAPAPPPRHALLRRLGPSPLGGKFPLVGLLASIYETIGNRAEAIRGIGLPADAGQRRPADGLEG